MKFATIKSLLVALTILAVISLSSARKSSRSKARVNADGATTGTATTATSKLVEYEATLSIKDDSANNDYKVKIDQESFNQMNYGIQFTMETGAVTNPAFFLVSANTYLFNFKNAHSFNCLNQAMFTQRAMHFSVYINKKTYDIKFTFPNGWAFGSSVNLLSLCNKFYDRWSITQTNRSTLEIEIMKIYSHIKLLEMTRSTNQNSKAGLQTQNAGLSQNIQTLNATIISQREEINKISKNIDVIGQLSAVESSKLDRIGLQIKEQEAKMTNQQDFIDDTKGDVASIRHIQQSEIDNEWTSFKVTLQKMIDIHSEVDPLKATLSSYRSNFIANYVNIMNALTL